MKEIYAIILAAGKGTRMKSKLHKVLHPVCEKPMLLHVADQVKQVQPKEIYIVVGHAAAQVQERLGEAYTYVSQEEQLGTGHAVMMAKQNLRDKQGITLIMYGDTPLVSAQTIQALIEQHEQGRAAATLLTAALPNPTGYGRVIRNEKNEVSRIVEEKDASADEKKVDEINMGMYCFDNQALWLAIDQMSNNNGQGEYYLTDCIAILSQQGKKVTAYVTDDVEEAMGVNDRIALAEAEKIMRKRINHRHMLNGVTLIDPEHTYIGPDVVIGQDTVIYPGSLLSGRTVIGESVLIGPHAELYESRVGDHSEVKQSVIQKSSIGERTEVGPFAYVRPGSKIGNRCKVGDFVEVKNSTIEDGTKISHLSYIGDADLGSRVNMGCGSITVNYDGKYKHRTIIEDDSFVGCNVNLIAPVRVGKGAYVAAGSTITDSVPEQSLAIARERQTTKENYVDILKSKRESK